MKAFLFTVAALVVIYIGSCSAISVTTTKKVQQIRKGDSKGSVLEALGRADVVETEGEGFTRYASTKCSESCVERLWYENRLSLDTEAWSVEVDDNGNVTHTAHWTSP